VSLVEELGVALWPEVIDCGEVAAELRHRPGNVSGRVSCGQVEKAGRDVVESRSVAVKHEHEVVTVFGLVSTGNCQCLEHHEYWHAAYLDLPEHSVALNVDAVELDENRVIEGELCAGNVECSECLIEVFGGATVNVGAIRAR